MAAASPNRSVPESPSPAGRILLLSGEQKAVSSIGRILEHHGFSLLTVSSPVAALEILNSDSSIDVVLVDAGPRFRHLISWVNQLAERRNSGPAQAAILLLPHAAQVPEAVECLRAGAYDYLPRPFSEQQLLTAVQRVMENRQLRVQNDFFKNHLEQMITARTRMLQTTLRQLEQSYDTTLEALGNALDMKDAETEGHSKRVTAYTLALGRAMGIDERNLRMIGRGAFLHDIGKMAIPDCILRKPGKLTAEEMETMRNHSELGYNMVRKIPFLQHAAEIVYAHQERFDGSGYPRRLRGEEIHIGARIFAVADTLDAITSHRPYRTACTLVEARREVTRCAGTQFDPAIVDVFQATPDAIWQDLRDGIMRAGPDFSPFGFTFGEGS